MKRIFNYLMLLFTRPDKSIEIVRCNDGVDKLRQPTIVVDGSSVMVQSPINQEITFTDLGNNEYIFKGKHIKPREPCSDFVCDGNGGVRCPWAEDVVFKIDNDGFFKRDVCLKCGRASTSSCQ